MNRFSDKSSLAPAGISSGRKSVFTPPPPEIYIREEIYPHTHANV
jgi:hypothetical protein